MDIVHYCTVLLGTVLHSLFLPSRKVGGFGSFPKTYLSLEPGSRNMDVSAGRRTAPIPWTTILDAGFLALTCRSGVTRTASPRLGLASVGKNVFRFASKVRVRPSAGGILVAIGLVSPCKCQEKNRTLHCFL